MTLRMTIESPRDVVQRQAREPAVAGLHAEVEGGADRAPEVVAVGEAHGARPPRGAAGEDPAVDRVQVVLAEQRQVGLGLREVGGAGDDEDRVGAFELGLALGVGQARVQRVGDRAQLHQRVHEDDEVGPGRELERDRPLAAHSARGQPPGDRARLGLELGVGQLLARRDQGEAVGAGLRALCEPVVEVQGLATRFVAIVPAAYADPAQGRTAARASSTRRSSGAARATSATSATRRPRGSRRSRSTGPRSATLFARRRWPSCARPSASPATTSRSGRSSSPARATQAFCSGGDQRIRGDDGYIGDDEVAQAASAGSTSATCTSRSGGCRSR